MAAHALLQKLRVKPGMTVAVIGAPSGFVKSLEPLPEGVRVVTRLPGRAGSPAVLAFARDRKALEAVMPKALDKLLCEGLLWLAYPKLESELAGDVSREVLGEVGRQHGWAAVAQIALDDTWSAMRFSPGEAAGR
jgi:hypothetical protein